jgi:hypothetical protein
MKGGCKVLKVLDILTVRNFGVVPIYGHSCDRFSGAFHCKILGERVSQPHVVASLIFERAERMSTKARNCNNADLVNTCIIPKTGVYSLYFVIVYCWGIKGGETKEGIIKSEMPIARE